MFLHIKLEITGVEGLMALLVSLNRKADKIMATLEERFNKVSSDLDEASAEILAEIATLKNQPLTPEQEAALANIEAKATALASLAPPIA